MGEYNDLKDVAAESGVVSSLIYHPEYYLVDNNLKPQFFTDKLNQCMFWAVQQLVESGVTTIDAINLENILNSNKAVKETIHKLNINDLQQYIDMAQLAERSTYKEYKLLVDNIIKIKGKLSINDRGVCVRVENISQIEDDTTTTESTVVKEEKKAVPRLYLMYDLTDQELSKEIYSLLRSYPGESPVIVICSKQQKPFQLGVTVNPKGFLINELHAFIEDDYIKVI